MSIVNKKTGKEIKLDIVARFPCAYCGDQLALARLPDGDYCGLHYGAPCETFLNIPLDQFITNNRRKLGIPDPASLPI
jgi:hypothetical protein